VSVAADFLTCWDRKAGEFVQPEPPQAHDSPQIIPTKEKGDSEEPPVVLMPVGQDMACAIL
jgi:hypothetical protein